MFPENTNARNLNIYFSVPSNTLHDIRGCSLHEVNGLAIAFHNRILERLHGWRESKHVLVKRNSLVHVLDRQHRTYPLRRCYGSHVPGILFRWYDST